MSDHMDLPGGADDGDRPLEPLLRTLAEDYHRPPATPREAMWEAIRAAREADRSGGAPGDAGREDVVALPPVGLVVTAEEARSAAAGRRGRARALAGRRWAGPLAALAAALLLGVGLGRWTTRSDGSSGAPAEGTPPIAAGPRTPAPAGAAAPASSAGVLSRSNAGAAAASERDANVATGGRGAPPRSQDAPAAARDRNPSAAGATVATPPVRLAAADPVAPRGVASAAEAEARVAGTYRVATVQHLGQAEALLTAFRAEPGAGVVTAAATDAWARELLTTTRLLLDSPAAADPQLGPLLGDLETVLVQIVHLPAARATRERQLIAQSLDQSQLMTHLRAAVPPGPAAPQRSGE